jgi:hypothetical protein
MKSSDKIIYWTPRILCIIAILFISIFALDAFDPENTPMQQLGDFLMHLIPSFVLTLILLIAWKWEYIGGIIFLLIGLGFSPIIFSHNYQMNHSVWMSLFIILVITFHYELVGILFIMSDLRKKRNRLANTQKE